MKTITFRVTPEDHELFVAVAHREGRSISNMLRTQVRALAEAYGLHSISYSDPNRAPDPLPPPPTPTRTMPRFPDAPDLINGNRLDLDMLRLLEGGETTRDIAISYGVDVQTVQARIAAGRRRRAEGVEPPTHWRASAQTELTPPLNAEHWPQDQWQFAPLPGDDAQTVEAKNIARAKYIISKIEGQ